MEAADAVFEKMAAYGAQELNLIVGGEASQERIVSSGTTGVAGVALTSDTRARQHVDLGGMSLDLRARAALAIRVTPANET